MNLDREKAIRELGISEELYDELMGMLVSEVERAIQNFDEALLRDDFETIYKTAHLIQGASGSLRIENIRNITADIERISREAECKSEIEENVSRLKKAFAALQAGEQGGA